MPRHPHPVADPVNAPVGRVRGLLALAWMLATIARLTVVDAVRRIGGHR